MRHLVSHANGLFNDFSGQIQVDPAYLEKIQVEVTIAVSSVNTDNEKRDVHLRSTDFFDAGSFPSITFKSTDADVQDDIIHVTGDFTMYGVTKRVVLAVTVL